MHPKAIELWIISITVRAGGFTEGREAKIEKKFDLKVYK